VPLDLTLAHPPSSPHPAPQVPRSDDFSVPGTGSKYFCSQYVGAEVRSGKVTAKEHRNVMQVLPFLLHELVADVEANDTRGGSRSQADVDALRALNASLVDLSCK
jgi:hypothetical protein